MFGFVTEALARRRAAGIKPFTVVSCDNLRHNGEVARTAFVGFASARDPELGAWIDSNVDLSQLAGRPHHAVGVGGGRRAPQRGQRPGRPASRWWPRTSASG